MVESSFSVVVPASTANLGPGFDSIGLALNLYMTVDVSPSEDWEVTYKDDGFEDLPTGEDNLIVKTVTDIADRKGLVVPVSRLIIQSDIPLGKGLGSSATAIAAGIEIANQLLVLNLSEKEKVLLGSGYEGHADNISAALLGGVTISYFDGVAMDIVHIPEPKMGAVILVPPEALLTEASRGLLPGELSHAEATRSSAAANVLSAAIARDDWETAGRMMEKDTFHEPYRKKLFPEFDRIRKVCQERGAYGVTISGAGPSLFVAVKQGVESELAMRLAAEFPYYDCIAVKPSIEGAMIELRKEQAPR
ncbi:homoserine kinase [Sporosarcina sp. ANT_H38]|uniref:homoserine kinase n=1 Tax=Sporosarcina sp. ANT_H38 TaxID=2597358 RepID=UPI0011F0D92F|nr:homoserine kinase [Sporosarcina sp. ANT_H38]KAA0940460.1 homoserine kinase [Sporosarcina sp. ANT_H38]